MRERLGEIREKLEERFGRSTVRVIFFLTTVAVTLMVSPLFQPGVVQVHSYLGSPGFDAPNVVGEIENDESVERIYKNQTVEKYDNLSWKSNYEVYRVRVRNTKTKPAKEILMTINFPGCVVASHKLPLRTGREKFRIINKPNRQLTGNITFDFPVRSCTKVIKIEELAKGEWVGASFVVTREPRDCTILTGLRPSRTFHVEYFWKAAGILIPENTTGQVQNARVEYTLVDNLVEESVVIPKMAHLDTFIYNATKSNGQISCRFKVPD